MHCPEFRDVMRAFLDGEVDGATRKKVGRHLAECAECAALVEDDHFWDDAIRRHLDHELPAGLREDILGDAAGLGGASAWRIGWWAIKRDLRQPRAMFQTAAVAAVLILALNYLPFFRSADKSFEDPGPVVQVGQEAVWTPGETVPTARLSLSGRLI